MLMPEPKPKSPPVRYRFQQFSDMIARQLLTQLGTSVPVRVVDLAAKDLTRAVWRIATGSHDTEWAPTVQLKKALDDVLDALDLSDL